MTDKQSKDPGDTDKAVDQGKEPVTVDLAEEAAKAVTPSGGKGKGKENASTSSGDGAPREYKNLEDFDEQARAFIESYTSRAVNDYREKVLNEREPDPASTKKQQPQPRGLTESEVLEIVSRRDQARMTMARVLAAEGIEDGSKAKEVLDSFYLENVKGGRLDPGVLLSEAGIRSLIYRSGALEVANEQSQASVNTGNLVPVVDGEEYAVFPDDMPLEEAHKMLSKSGGGLDDDVSKIRSKFKGGMFVDS